MLKGRWLGFGLGYVGKFQPANPLMTLLVAAWRIVWHPTAVVRGVLRTFDAGHHELRSARPADPKQPVLTPGDRARSARQRSIEKGIQLDDKLWEDLKALAAA